MIWLYIALGVVAVILAPAGVALIGVAWESLFAKRPQMAAPEREPPVRFGTPDVAASSKS